ncbi:MAG TPA: hypothetical protein VEP91_06755 [Solirubrobacterales bacterium]|nr:hypothetical protein [Solirubrobacterales bacterium]
MNTLALKRRGIPALLLILLGIAVGATVLSLDDSSSSPAAPEAQSQPTEKVAPIAAVQPDQARAFGLFRGTPEELPASVKLMLGGEGHGLNLALAQKATPPGAEGPVWVIPGDDWICVFVELDRSGASSCDTTQGAVADGIDLAIASPSVDGEASEIKSTVGLVADQVTAVRFDGNPRGPEKANLEGNAFYVEGGSQAAPALTR